jgi:hypothetical protein
MTRIIRDWDELVGLESETHYLEIDLRYGSGHIVNKDKQAEREYNYLSTHTFYGGNVDSYKESTRRLREKGFDIIIDNWDNPLPDDLDTEEFIRQIDESHRKYKEQTKLEAEREQLRINRKLFESEEILKLRLKRESEWNRTHAQNRNELCNCGSGKKFKKCCGR